MGGKYKPAHYPSIKAYYIEDDWVYCDVVYSAYERFVYIHKSHFSQLPSNITSVDQLHSYRGVTTEHIIPSFGPEDHFLRHTEYQIQPGTNISAFFQMNGYVYSEFYCSAGLVRMWLPNSAVEIFEATIDVRTVSPGPTTPPTPTPKPNLDQTFGTWSSWQDTPIKERDGIEVQTRTLYRIKAEIEDWTDWIDGDAEAINEGGIRRETRVIVRDGVEVHQWREYGYHYHYGEWSDWTEQKLIQSSSTDIVETKTQYRSRKVIK